VDALGPDGRDVPALASLVGELRAATGRGLPEPRQVSRARRVPPGLAAP
jgi:hypothetical protein